MNPQLRLLNDVTWNGTPVAGERVKSLLRTLGHAGARGLSASQLIEAVWEDAPPAHPSKALQVLVSRARAQTSADAISRTASGYCLSLPATDVDTWALRSTLDQAEAALTAGAIDTALNLATAATDLDDDAGARRIIAVARSRQGHHRQVLDELETLAEAHPLDEELTSELLRSIAAVKGPAAALQRFEAIRAHVTNELGSGPGPLLRTVHQELLALDQPVRSGVRHSATSLLGRDHDITALSGLLASTRLVTITGPGGLGKTRLAQELARRTPVPRVYVVELATIRSNDEVLAAIADTLHIRENISRIERDAAGGNLRDRLIAVLNTGPNMLVLDNCEHIIDGVADIVHDLVAAVPGLRILATSRTPLRHTAEHVYPLEQLSTPQAKELFAQRARAARPSVNIDDETISALVTHLDGLPLAIELAAARTRTLTPEIILENLTDRFSLLRSGDRTAPERHQTLQAVIDWSWQLLEEDAQEALMSMALLPDAFGADCSEYILGNGAMKTVEDLVDQSLLTVIEREGSVRFRMLETIREYGHLRRSASAQRARLEDTVERWAVDTCAGVMVDILGPAQLEAADMVRAEELNLTPVLRKLLVRGDDRAITMLATLMPFWMVCGEHIRIIEHFHPLERFLSTWTMPASMAEQTRRVLAVQATTWGMLPRWHELTETSRRLEELGSDSPSPVVLAMTKLALAVIKAPHTHLGSQTLTELEELTDSSDRLTRLVSLPFLVGIKENAGEVAAAITLLEGALGDFQPEDPPWLLTHYRESLAQLNLQYGDFKAAHRHALEALPCLTRFGNLLECRSWLAMAKQGLGELDHAEEELAALAVDEDRNEPFGNRFMLTLCRAELALQRGDIATGLDLLSVVRHSGHIRPAIPGMVARDGLDPWTLLINAVSAAVAARHDPKHVDELCASLLDRAERATSPGRSHYDFPVLGTVAFGIAVWVRERGQTKHHVPEEFASQFASMATRMSFNRAFPSLNWQTFADSLTPAQAAHVDQVSAELEALDFTEVLTRFHSLVHALRSCVDMSAPSTGQR